MRLFCCVLTALAATAAAAAAAPWSSPGTFAASVGTNPLLVGGPSGPRAVYWDSYPPGLPTPGQFTTFVSPLGPGLEPGPPQAVGALGTLGGGNLRSSVYGPGDLVVPESTRVARGPFSGPFLRTPAFAAPVRGVAANAAGDIAVVIEPCARRVSGCRPAAPQLVYARRGRGFGRPITLDRRGHGYSAAVAIDPAGRVLVAWDRDGRAYARFASTRGKLTAPQTLGGVTAPAFLQADLAGDGRAAVGWTSQAVSEGDAGTPFTATVALAGTRRRFGGARLLGAVPVTGVGRYIPYQGLALSLPAGQPGLAAWSGFDGAHYVVRAAALTGTTVGPTETVSEPGIDTVLADATEGPRGQAVILLLPNRAGADPPIASTAGNGLLAVSRPAAAQPFGSPEEIVPSVPRTTVVAPGTPPTFIDGAYVGIDAATGAAFATWRDVGGPIGWSLRSPLG